MGGFGAMRNGLKYADTFGAIATLSGAFILHEPDPEKEDEADDNADVASVDIDKVIAEQDAE